MTDPGKIQIHLALTGEETEAELEAKVDAAMDEAEAAGLRPGEPVTLRMGEETAAAMRAAGLEPPEPVTFTNGPPMVYLATCQDCVPVLPQPFSDKSERDTWARVHRDATGHAVDYEDRPRGLTA